MKYILKLLIITSCFNLYANSYIIEIATCKGTVGSVDLIIEFFEELDSETEKSTGQGLYSNIISNSEFRNQGALEISSTDIKKTARLFNPESNESMAKLIIDLVNYRATLTSDDLENKAIWESYVCELY